MDAAEAESQFTADEWVTPDDFYAVAKKTNSVMKFSKVAYPDLHGSKFLHRREPLYERKSGVQR